MGFNGNFDATMDAALGEMVVSAQAANNTTNTSILTIANVPTDLTCYANIFDAGVGAADYVVITIMGSTSSTFASGNYVLGHFILGDAALIGTTFGVAPSADRGFNHYAIRFHNTHPVAYESGEVVVCPYIRITSKTVGATSTLTAKFVLGPSR